MNLQVVLEVNGSDCSLKYYEFDHVVQIPLSSVSHIKPVESGAIREEDILHLPYKCQVKYAPDGQWYDAVITAKTLYVTTSHKSIIMKLIPNDSGMVFR